ncbi:peptidase domain-containing ABC transporter [Leptodesmis sichuanensis]|uniref:peptidase domain-containing ABC transporter n=1 Tax=Leptodesmis sichuanensis TaxID=2906798 RepID=UPI001F29E215|nr:peptidase domain-containing ABC transporter [Leptodesmis sichuanensis]UIE38136.1 peptidase domain-containing ABC transporter [Leptodesmis sichuanensis A121]
MVAQPEIYTLNLPWDEAPLCLLEDQQKLQFRQQVQISRHTTGEPLWSSQTPGCQILVLAGKVRLVQEKGSSVLEPGKSILLKSGDWFGDRLELAGNWKARAASKEVVVALWQSNDWQEIATPDLQDFWESVRWRYQPVDPRLPHPASGYPYEFHLNTAAACLTMVTQQLQTPIPLQQIQRQVRGQSPQNLAEAAEKIGLQLHHIQQISWTGLDQLTFPALMHWNQEQWVVVYEVQAERMVIADPLNRHKRCESLPKETILEAWDGQLWLVQPAPKADSFNLRWFLPAVWQYRGLLAEVLLTSLILQVLGLTSPMLTQVIIDKVIVHSSLSTLHVIAIALLGVGIFEAVLGIIRLFIFTHTARRLDLRLSSQLFRHLLELPLAYFEARRVGDTVARAQELENIRQFLTGTALTVVIDSIFMVVYLGLMLFYSVKLTAISLAVLPVLIAMILITTPILRNWLNESFNRHADSQSFLVETVTGIHAIKAHTAQLSTRERWEGLFARYIRTNFRSSTLSNIDSHVGEFLINLSELLVLWFGAMLVIEHHLSVGQLVAFQMLSGKAIAPLLHLAQLWQNFQQVLLSVDRIGDILNEAPESTSETGVVLPPVKGQVTFDKIFFRYQPENDDVLKGISFDIQPGMFVGVVGRSGSGKSTLSKLIQRLYQPRSGRVLIDGFDIKGANLQSLRQQIGTVLQDDFLFNGTVFDNITFNNADIPPEQVVEAAKMAAAHDFISELPQGYETHIGERGTGLSGGQRQRLALTRLFLSKAPLLILDEATSALDSETERKVLQNLQRVKGDRTVLMITHRFAPLKHADLVLVLEKGVLIEQGTHAELLQQKGAYWALYQQQQAAV